MKSSGIEQKLQQSYLDLSKAHQGKDWESLASLESGIRDIVREVANSNAGLTVNGQRLLEDLQQLYQEIMDTCQQERGQTQRQIVDRHKRQKRLSSYLGQQENDHSGER